MSFIVIEGLDGSGKSTQIRMLKNFLKQNTIKYKFLHFPRTESGIYGDLIARFLRGELGDINTVNPYLIALIYAGDRKEVSFKIEKWLSKDYLVIVDRYIYSNIAFQCAKIDTQKKREELADWINNLEYMYNKIPVPDLNLFLDVPFEFTKNKLTGSRKGDEREYLKGNKDIHEENLSFQKKVREMYFWQIKENSDFVLINCKGKNNEMLKAEKIFERILNKINFQF